MAIVNTQNGSSQSLGLGFTAVAGRIILALVSSRNWDVTFTPGGVWVALATVQNPSGYPPAMLVAAVAAGGETSVGGTFNDGGVNRMCSASEFTGLTLDGKVNGGCNFGTVNPAAPPAVTPTAGADCLIANGYASRSDVFTAINGTGYSASGQQVAGGGDWPWGILAWRIVTAASGSYNSTASKNNGGAQHGASSGILYAAVVPGRASQAIIF